MSTALSESKKIQASIRFPKKKVVEAAKSVLEKVTTSKGMPYDEWLTNLTLKQIKALRDAHEGKARGAEHSNESGSLSGRIRVLK